MTAHLELMRTLSNQGTKASKEEEKIFSCLYTVVFRFMRINVLPMLLKSRRKINVAQILIKNIKY